MWDLQHPFRSMIHRDQSSIDWLCHSQEGWGPLSPGRFGLTTCFEFSILFGALASLMMLSVLIRLLYISRTLKPHRLRRTAWIYWPTQIAMGSTAVVSLTLAILMQHHVPEDSSPAATLGYLLVGCAWLLAAILNRMEHKYTIRSSDTLFVCYLLFIPALTIHVRTLLLLHYTDYVLEAKLDLIMIVFLTIGFIVEACPRGSTAVQRSSLLPLYDKANIFMRRSFYFWQNIISTSVKRTLTQNDISNNLPESVKTKVAYSRFEKFWSRAVEKSNVLKKKAKRSPKGTQARNEELCTPSLFRTIMRALLVHFPVLFLYGLSQVLASYSVPAVLSHFLVYLQDAQKHQEGDGTSLTYGLLLVFGMFFGALLTAILTFSSKQYSIMIGLEIRSALISAIYRKALRLSPGSRNKSTTGEITNHMATDADKWADGIVYLNMWISVPMEIGVGLWLLFRLLGWSVWAGIFVMAAMTPLQIWRAKNFGKIESENMAKMDERIRLTTEILSAIKVVKLYNWEEAFKNRLLAVRDEGLAVSRLMGKIYSIMSIVFTSSTLIICLATLSVYAAWGGPESTPGDLTPQKVFVSMTLFAMLRAPIGSLTETATNTVSLLVACRRLQTFLLREEINVQATTREPDLSKRRPTEPMILIEDATFSWSLPSSCSNEDDGEEIDERSELLGGTDSENASIPMPTLKSINLAFDHGQIVAVVGRVGQGKSSLISSITGEMYKWHGRVKTYGRVAIVPQQAWILNATLRDNVLFGKPYDSERYQRIIHACGLEPDIEMLPAGDMTEIGERGINLSGGQKQRVSLARSAYDDADIYLLDDPLSAVDAHVDHHLWKELIGPKGLLSQKTRILVTHGIHHLQEVDKVVVLKEGRVVEQGHYDDLMKTQQTFYQLILEYSAQYRASTQAAVETYSTPSTMNESAVDSQEGPSDQEDDSATIQEVSAETSPSKKPTRKDTKAKLITAEKIKEGNVDLSVYKAYFRAFSYANLIFLVVFLSLAQIILVGVNLWLKHWINLEEQGKEKPSLRYFLSVFAVLTFVYSVLNVAVMWVTFVRGRIRASRTVHRELLCRVMRLPGAFFDTTPLGRVLNRFSSDLNSIDDKLTWKISDSLEEGATLLASLTVIAFTMPLFLIALPVFLAAFYALQIYFLHASRDCKRILQVTKSPIFQHFTETLGGVSTIRAMGLESRFVQANADKNDVHSNACVAFRYTIQWMGVQTQFLSAWIIFVISLFFVLSPRGSTDASTAGLALSFALSIAQSLSFFVRSSCELQNFMIGMERIMELTLLNTEATLGTNPDSVAGRALKSAAREGRPWPQRGEIVFENYSTRYREGLDLVLRGVSFKAEAGTRTGIVGRTGAGKSSLTLALFRMIEAADSPLARASDNSGRVVEYGEDDSIDIGGRILIDGLDISQLGLSDLREQLAIIPQEPVLFAGTVRENLDPFGQADDASLWQALERAHLKDFIVSLDPTGEDGGEGGLSFRVAQHGENFSVGQRSLLCLARALLRKTRILILDEATSAVDVETDELIQKTIRKEFADRTILTIAHRIKTVMDSDKILVLDQGSVVECDTPSKLVQNPKSLFYKLARQAGELQMLLLK